MPRYLILAVPLALVACNNGQPHTFRVALEQGSALANTCWKNSMPPTSFTTESTNNLVAEEQWVIWDGVEKDGTPSQFLDHGTHAFKLGDSPQVSFDEVVKTTVNGKFIAKRQVSTSTPLGAGTIVQVRTSTLTFTFSDLGNSPTGTLDVDSQYACSAQNGATCPNESFVSDPRSCVASTPFAARKIDVSRIANYTEEGKSSGNTPGGSSSSGSGD